MEDGGGGEGCSKKSVGVGSSGEVKERRHAQNPHDTHMRGLLFNSFGTSIH
jgi:hypothetical protein